MKSAHTQLALLVASGIAITSSTKAAVIAYEGFDYTAGTTISASLGGGSGWSNSWTSQTPQGGTNWATNATGLTYTDGTKSLIVSAGSMSDSTSSGDGNRWRRNFAIPSGSWGSSSTWFSFLTDRSDTNAATTQQWNFRLQTGASTIAQIKNISSTTDGWEILNSAGASQANTTAISELSAVFVVGRVTHDGGSGNDLIELWFNPNLTTPGAATISATFANFSGLDGFSFETGSTPTGRFDEIRFGTTFADVAPTPVPEPAAVAVIAGCGALGFAASRRPRRV